MSKLTNDQIGQNVRGRYQKIAVKKFEAASSCCAPADSCCDSPSDFDAISAKLGYSSEDLAAAPEGANLGLGCGNPQAIAELQAGEHVLDLGSGGGFDCFLASRQVGEQGHVIGVDMTPEMISRARDNAIKGKYTNTEFRLGEIEHLPLANNSVNVIISNCVINLSPDKQQVFREAYRVLQPGGRLAISDIVTTAELPPEIKNDLDELYSGCISGASSIADVEQMLRESGFSEISIEPKTNPELSSKTGFPVRTLTNTSFLL